MVYIFARRARRRPLRDLLDYVNREAAYADGAYYTPTMNTWYTAAQPVAYPNHKEARRCGEMGAVAELKPAARCPPNPSPRPGPTSDGPARESSGSLAAGPSAPPAGPAARAAGPIASIAAPRLPFPSVSFAGADALARGAPQHSKRLAILVALAIQLDKLLAVD